MKEIRPYTDKHGELSPAIYREEAAPCWFGQVEPTRLVFSIFKIIFVSRARISRAGSRRSHHVRDFAAPIGDGLARTRAPGPRAAQLPLCTPEKLVLPDVLPVPSRYRTAFPAVPSWYCTDLISKKNYSRTQGNARSILYSLSNFAAQAPTKLSFERKAEP